jgi:hypothetical protein
VLSNVTTLAQDDEVARAVVASFTWSNDGVMRLDLLGAAAAGAAIARRS